MVREPDNLGLIQSWEIRAKLDKLDSIETKLDKLDSGFDTLRFQLTHTFGLAGMANLQGQRAEATADAAVDSIKRMDAQMAEIARRLASLEDTPQI